MTRAFVALGSNLCRPQLQMRRAVAALQALPHSRVEAVSSVYRSRAQGPGAQPDYLNAVVMLATELRPLDLLDALQRIEQEQGRTREIRWGPRTLDLDLLLYGDQSVNSPRLVIPHPRMRERHFVVYPLLEIAGPDLQLPDGTDIATLVCACSSAGLTKTRHQLRTGQPVPRKIKDQT